jgi:alpha-L-fucosidase
MRPAIFLPQSFRLLFFTPACALLAVMLSGCKPAQPAAAPTDYLTETPEARDARMAWWREARFGMFIHWGLYALPAGEWNGRRTVKIGEWIMDELDIPIAEYEKFAPQFNPSRYRAAEWVAIAKNAGMRYIVITSKHHDGFALWDSKVSQWDIADATPYEKDILRELVTACRAAGIRIGFYHSIMDWHHPDAQAIFAPDYNQQDSGARANPNFPRYVESYLKPQLRELLTQYGKIDILWFDGEWIPDYTSEMGKDIYQFVRALQPDILINNRVDKGRQGMQGMNKSGIYAGDFGTPEQEIPATGIPGVDWESCMTMNDTWGYTSFGTQWKSAGLLLRNLVDIASKGGNFLLNVGPDAAGLIPAASVARLDTLGRWMQLNGEAIYGTTASPVAQPAWGRCTQKQAGDSQILYLHVFDWPQDGRLRLSGLAGMVKKASLLAGGEAVAVKKEGSDWLLLLPQRQPDAICTVVKVVL